MHMLDFEPTACKSSVVTITTRPQLLQNTEYISMITITHLNSRNRYKKQKYGRNAKQNTSQHKTRIN